MQNLQLISTKELRDNLAEVLEMVAIAKQSFLVSKFGREKVLIVPVVSPVKTLASKRKMCLASHPACGIWEKRKEMENPAEWVSKLRIRQSLRLK